MKDRPRRTLKLIMTSRPKDLLYLTEQPGRESNGIYRTKPNFHLRASCKSPCNLPFSARGCSRHGRLFCFKPKGLPARELRKFRYSGSRIAMSRHGLGTI